MSFYRDGFAIGTLVMAVLFLLGFLYQLNYISIESPQTKINGTANTTKHRSPPILVNGTAKDRSLQVKFVYHTQAPQCLSSYYLLSSIVGDPKSCRCLVVVLSYETLCTNNSHPHVRYFHVPGTTLNSGRNLQHSYTTKYLTKIGAIYHLFMDEDAIFQKTDPSLLEPSVRPKVDPKLPILRQYENFLLRIKPAVSTSIYSTSTNARRFKGDFITTCCKMKNGSTLLFPEFFPLISFDTCFFVFHADAAPHLLPIPLKYESKSWWMSDIILPFRVYAKYRGQALVYSPMHTLNRDHGDYPKVGGGVVGYDVVMNEERDLAPSSIRNSIVWKDPLFKGKRQPPYYSMVNPQFEYVPYSKNPNMIPFHAFLNVTGNVPT